MKITHIFLGLFAGESTKDLNRQIEVTNTNREILKFISVFYAKEFGATDCISAFVGAPNEAEVLNAKEFLKTHYR